MKTYVEIAAAAFAIAAGGALAAGAASPVDALAGRYSHHFRNGLVSGEEFFSDDVAEIVPVDATHAYVRFELSFYNGHSCSLAGVAAAKGDSLVYTEPADRTLADEQRCTLKVRRTGAKLTWDDDGSCKTYCGERGSFSRGDLPWASRRAIGYLAKLKGSSEYKHAVTVWRTGHAQK